MIASFIRGTSEKKISVDSKIDGIELLRFLLAFSVMIYHYAYFGPISGKLPSVEPGPDWLVAGRFGVSAFFIISGFVIMYSAGSRAAGSFALARFSRLAPAMLVCATITMLVFTFWPGSATTPSFLIWVKSASTVGLLAGSPYVDGSYWSITIELRFYFYVVVMLLVLGGTQHIRLIVLAWMGLSFVSMAFYDFTPLRLLTLSPHGGYFIAGIILYCWLIQGDQRFAAWTLPAATLLCIWQSYVEFKHIAEMSGTQSTWLTGWLAALISLALVWMMAFGITHPLVNRAVRVLGAMSYPLYLLHQSLGYLLIEFMVSEGLGSTVAIALCAAIMCWAAYLVARHVEPAGRTLILRLAGTSPR